MKRLLISIFILLLSGCTSVDPTVGVISTNTTIKTNPVTITNQTNTTTDLIPNYNNTISLGKFNVTYFNNGTYQSLTNCGERAYGPVLVEELNRLGANKFDLIIDNSSKEMIGGCKDVIINMRGISKVILLINETDSQEYKDIIFWTPVSKLVRE